MDQRAVCGPSAALLQRQKGCLRDSFESERARQHV